MIEACERLSQNHGTAKIARGRLWPIQIPPSFSPSTHTVHQQSEDEGIILNQEGTAETETEMMKVETRSDDLSRTVKLNVENEDLSMTQRNALIPSSQIFLHLDRTFSTNPPRKSNTLLIYTPREHITDPECYWNQYHQSQHHTTNKSCLSIWPTSGEIHTFRNQPISHRVL